jgi:hypothetical protein
VSMEIKMDCTATPPRNGPGKPHNLSATIQRLFSSLESPKVQKRLLGGRCITIEGTLSMGKPPERSWSTSAFECMRGK